MRYVFKSHDPHGSSFSENRSASEAIQKGSEQMRSSHPGNLAVEWPKFRRTTGAVMGEFLASLGSPHTHTPAKPIIGRED